MLLLRSQLASTTLYTLVSQNNVCATDLEREEGEWVYMRGTDNGEMYLGAWYKSGSAEKSDLVLLGSKTELVKVAVISDQPRYHLPGHPHHQADRPDHHHHDPDRVLDHPSSSTLIPKLIISLVAIPHPEHCPDIHEDDNHPPTLTILTKLWQMLLTILTMAVALLLPSASPLPRHLGRSGRQVLSPSPSPSSSPSTSSA